MRNLLQKLVCLFIFVVASGFAVTAFAVQEYWKMKASKLEKLADQNDMQAQWYLGMRYINGNRDVKADKARGAYWLAKSAEGGSDKAQFYLGKMYMQGDGVELNHSKAISLFRQCIDNVNKTDRDAQNLARINLAVYYLDGNCGLERDEARALELLEGTDPNFEGFDGKKWFDHWRRDAMLGELYYEKGRSTLDTALFKKSAGCYVNAAEDWMNYSAVSLDVDKNRQRIGEAWLKAGNSLFFYNVMSGDEDYTKIFNYWNKAFMNKNMQAAYNLGELYYTGIGNQPADEEEGIYYLKLAARDNPRAAYFLGIHYYAKDVDFTKAFQYLNKVIDNPGLDNNDVRADVLQKLSAMYRFGRGTVANEKKADELTAEAAKLGNPDALRVQQWLQQR